MNYRKKSTIRLCIIIVCIAIPKTSELYVYNMKVLTKLGRFQQVLSMLKLVSMLIQYKIECNCHSNQSTQFIQNVLIWLWNTSYMPEPHDQLQFREASHINTRLDIKMMSYIKLIHKNAWFQGYGSGLDTEIGVKKQAPMQRHPTMQL